MAKKCKIGDIIEIPTPSGLAYAQFTHLHPRYNALLRVLPGKYESRPVDLSRLAQSEEKFATFFPLQAALNQGIFCVVANHSVPATASTFPLFRTGIEDPQTRKVKVWWLWDGEKEWKVGDITPEQRRLPLRGIWNDTLLIERIDANWTPENDPT